jgi:hypothetical protein
VRGKSAKPKLLLRSGGGPPTCSEASALPGVYIMSNNEQSEYDHYRKDYEKTYEQFKLLSDFRFRLLGFLPILVGATITFLSKETTNAAFVFAVGFLGFVVTLGILFYEIRNSQLYDASIHRAKYLESLLNLPISSHYGKNSGGLFSERPKRSLKLFGLFPIWHDGGLALVYGATLGGWIFLITDALLRILNWDKFVIATLPTNFVFSILSSIVSATLFITEFYRIDRAKDQPKPPAWLRINNRGFMGETGKFVLKHDASKNTYVIETYSKKDFNEMVKNLEIITFQTHTEINIVVGSRLAKISQALIQPWQDGLSSSSIFSNQKAFRELKVENKSTPDEQQVYFTLEPFDDKDEYILAVSIAFKNDSVCYFWRVRPKSSGLLGKS